jgi:hypothetical protein
MNFRQYVKLRESQSHYTEPPYGVPLAHWHEATDWLEENYLVPGAVFEFLAIVKRWYVDLGKKINEGSKGLNARTDQRNVRSPVRQLGGWVSNEGGILTRQVEGAIRRSMLSRLWLQQLFQDGHSEFLTQIGRYREEAVARRAGVGAAWLAWRVGLEVPGMQALGDPAWREVELSPRVAAAFVTARQGADQLHAAWGKVIDFLVGSQGKQ